MPTFLLAHVLSPSLSGPLPKIAASLGLALACSFPPKTNMHTLTYQHSHTDTYTHIQLHRQVVHNCQHPESSYPPPPRVNKLSRKTTFYKHKVHMKLTHSNHCNPGEVLSKRSWMVQMGFGLNRYCVCLCSWAVTMSLHRLQLNPNKSRGGGGGGGGQWQCFLLRYQRTKHCQG